MNAYGRPPRSVVIEGEVVSSPSYGAFSATPLDTGERVFIQAKMEATVAAVRAAFAAARARAGSGQVLNALFPAVSTMLSMVGIGSTEITSTNVLNALTTLQGSFEQLCVDTMGEVYSGNLDANRWFNATGTYVDGIKSILDELHESGAAASLSAVFNGMWNDTKDFLSHFKAGVQATFDYMPLIVGAAALLGTYIVVTRILPQRKALSGYRPKRRKLRLT